MGMLKLYQDVSVGFRPLGNLSNRDLESSDYGKVLAWKMVLKFYAKL